MPVTIFWTLIDRSQLPVREPGSWLSVGECQKLTTLRFAKRREEWLLGRWAAKSLARTMPGFHGYALSDLEVRNSADGSPQLFRSSGDPFPVWLSLSHREGQALAGMTFGSSLRIGVDLEMIESHPDEFIRDYFTAGECAWLASSSAADRDFVGSLIWSTKESMLKALQVGLRWDTRRVEVFAPGDFGSTSPSGLPWQRIRIRESVPTSRQWAAWWQRRRNLLMTIAGMSVSAADLESVEFEEHSLKDIQS